MKKDEIIDIANSMAFLASIWIEDDSNEFKDMVKFAKLVAAKEREALEAELLKLKQGIAANREYIQGRWDLIGELQDIIRARGEA